VSQNNDRRTIGLIFLIVLAVFLLPLLLMGFGMVGFGMMGGTWGGHMWGDGQAGGWFPLAGVAMQLLFLLVVVGGGYLLYRGLAGDGDDSAMEELRSAYARGELSDEEYEQRREALARDRRD